MEIFENDPSLEIPTVIPQLIGSYLIDESPRSRTTSKEQDDDELGEGMPNIFEAFNILGRGFQGFVDNIHTSENNKVNCKVQ